MAKGSKFNIGRLLSVSVQLLTLDLSARMIDQLPLPDPRIKGIATITVALARFPILKRMTKGLPFGIGTILSSLMALSAVQIVFSQLPVLISSFSTTQEQAPFLQP